jgi:exoribonuclease R
LPTAAGHLKLFPDNSFECVQFSFVDKRLPRMQIPLRECPFDYAIGILRCIIGNHDDIAAETEAILLENGVDSTELKEDLLKDCLPKLPW